MSVFPILLYEYLVRERQLPIRSLGVVFLQKHAPFFDRVKGVFSPPRYVYAFKRKEEVSEEQARLLEDFLAQKMNATPRSVSDQLYKWQDSIYAYCTDGQVYPWLDIGEFYRAADGHLSFRSEKEVCFFSDVFVLNRKTELDENKQTYTHTFFTDAPDDEDEDKNPSLNAPQHVSLAPTNEPTSENTPEENTPENNDTENNDTENNVSQNKAPENDASTVLSSPPRESDAENPPPSPPETITEFVEIDAPEKFSILQKIFIIVLLLGMVIYIFLYLFFNDFSFHSYAN